MSPEQQDFVFVNGPALGSGSDAKSRNIRSALIKRRITEKQDNFRREEAAKRERLIQRRNLQGQPNNNALKAFCSCRRESQDVGTSQTQMSRKNSPAFLVASDRATICGTCTVTCIWPAFRQSDYAGNCYQAWMLQSSQNKLLIYSTLWAASYHRDILRISYGSSDPVLETKEQLYYKGLVLRTLYSDVADYENEERRDGVIMCILYLAVNDCVKEKVARDTSPFTPPFVDLQYLSFYGSREYHSTHWGFIQTLLGRLGGIHSINVQGRVYNPPSALGVFQVSSKPPMSGFQDLLSLTPPVKEEIVGVFIHLGEFSEVVQLYCNRDLDVSTMDLIADIRNQVHHKLFGLPDEHDRAECIIRESSHASALGDNSQSLEIYYACRLSAFLYALHVTFPAPKSAMLRATIVPQLTQRLHQASQNVSAIGAEGMTQRQLLSVTQFSSILRSFAWVDFACSAGFHRLWGEVMPPS
ncbi:uncharacterized protein BDW43DRAFT_297237 [Aspergillus alliaceus]|uniref:uncharacterized protein n=1 Tax=Petromyces alliaceus TaxID=209559 RepID=UPI0012A614FF|nr:uncharacterized protein BDW43DRAFT_297237 [Aspergillus alliaceus]KAB8237512.1 hypothetical protein BDW43DRAFT_297237 [Aspergillus alliaceus]